MAVSPNGELRGMTSPNGQPILVVEDQELLVKLYTSALERHGWAVHTAMREDDAFILFEKLNPPVVLSDYNLPNGNGISLLKRIKKHRPATEVVLISGFLTNDQVCEALDEGAYQCLKKPSSLNVVTDVVAEALHKTIKERTLSAAED